jgi:hypothetical protein
LYPLLSGLNREHHGRVLESAAELAEQGHDLVSAGTTGKVVIEFDEW